MAAHSEPCDFSISLRATAKCMFSKVLFSSAGSSHACLMASSLSDNGPNSLLLYNVGGDIELHGHWRPTQHMSGR